MVAKYSTILSLAGLVLLLGFAVADEEAPAAADTRKAVDVVIDGTHIWVPYYDNSVSEIKPERRQFEQEAMEEMYELLTKLSTDIIVEHKTYIGLISYMGKCFSFARAKQNKIFELDARGFKPQFTDEFTSNIKSLWKKINARGGPDVDMIAIKSTPPKVFNDKFKVFLRKILVETPAQSPVGIWLDWAEMKVDGKPLVEVARFYSVYMKENCSALSFFQGILTFLSKFLVA